MAAVVTAVVIVEHVRALCAGDRNRTALVLTPAGPRVVTPDATFTGVVDGSYLTLLCTRSELIEDGLRVGGDGQLTGPTVEVCGRVVAYWNRVLGDDHR